MNNVDKKFIVYRDLPGHTAPGGGSIPPELSVTAFKPDIVILDKDRKKQIAQIHEARHNTVQLQISYISTLPHSLPPHFLVQKRPHISGPPLPPAYLGRKDKGAWVKCLIAIM